MILKSILHLILILAILQSCSVQKNNYPYRIIDLKEKRTILKKMIDYDSSINVADSWYKEYNEARFDMKTKNKGSYSDGLSFVRSLYLTAKKQAQDTTYASSQISLIEKQIEESYILDLEKVYKKLINRAEEYYAAEKFDRAIELYKRAVAIKPNDNEAKSRLNEIEREMLKSKPKTNR